MSENFAIRTSWLAGELAGAAGVSTDTLRHYERKGVLPRPLRTANGYRHYPESALERVLLVRRALAVGFTLDELAQIFKELDRGGVPCGKVRALAGKKLLEVEEQLKVLTSLRDALNDIVADWDERLAVTPAGGRAGLLNSLSADKSAERNGKAKLPHSLKLNQRKAKQ
ncbi:MAG: heavy metal-responsive transcriptional regulator [Pyrinomonadaceae bacterium]